jgi:hypothetical protein
MAGPLERGVAFVPVGGLLVGVAHAQHGGLVERRPVICSEIGRPEVVKPQGTASDGSPVMLNGPVLPRGSRTRIVDLGERGAGFGLVGVASTSTRRSAAAMSVWSRVRIRCACTYSRP